MASKIPPEIKTLSQQTRALADVVNNEPDMACVLITGSFLDQCLASLLRKHFMKSNTADNLLNFKGSLGTFSSRVNMCYCLGLITKGMRQNLDTIGDIRNLFGHSHLSLDFGNQDIKKLCDELKYPKNHEVVSAGDEDPFSKIQGSRSRFSIIAFLLANRLLLTGLSTSHRERLKKGWE